MTHHYELLQSERLEDVHETLNQVIGNPTYQAYASEHGPLPLDDVPSDLRARNEFDQVVDYFGWPGRRDADIKPGPQFTDIDEFRQALAARKREFAHLNNFVAWVSQRPSLDALDTTQPMERIYGRSPALHRLHAVAPDLAGSVQVLVTDIRRRTGTHTADMEQELSRPDNRTLLEAVHLTYRIAGRLFTVNDRRLQHALLLPGGDPTNSGDVTSVLEELAA